MPFGFSTSRICTMLIFSRQTLTKARQSLADRGLIRFEEGSGLVNPASYTILPPRPVQSHQAAPSRPAAPVQQPASQQTAPQQPESEPETKEPEQPEAAPQQQEPLPQLAPEPVPLPEARGPEELPLEQIEAAILADTETLGRIATALRKTRELDDDAMEQYVHQFFELERARGVKCRSGDDCRRHFFNWLNKEIRKPIKTIRINESSRLRRGSEVTARTAADYQRGF